MALAEYENWGPAGEYDRAKLTCFAPKPGFVVFNYNPNKITFKRSAKAKSRTTAGSSTGSQLQESELITISVNGNVLEGTDTKARCDLLLSWAAPPDNRVEAALVSLLDLAVELPRIQFQWGLPAYGFVCDVVMTNCDVTYERFDSMGVPSRAVVNLTLIEQPPILPFTNPTSGGLPGRRAHQVCEGERLAQITTKELGHPRHWRELARSNDIDDPLRVRPGQYIYVPNPSELKRED
ncbi:hypothetical protein AB0D08_32290 [Kitasatospora sp. NPDC048540]|uniref:CIS tube protein n=1 Tax=unclassified Kitasatospora TaxID=2633591 RepID=UPI00068CAFCD|nr:hypothetical protein [Kitasatospora sp. MBT63]